MKTELEEVLRTYFGCQGKVFNAKGKLTHSGIKAYEKLKELLHDLDGLEIIPYSFDTIQALHEVIASIPYEDNTPYYRRIGTVRRAGYIEKWITMGLDNKETVDEIVKDIQGDILIMDRVSYAPLCYELDELEGLKMNNITFSSDRAYLIEYRIDKEDLLGRKPYHDIGCDSFIDVYKLTSTKPV